MEQSPRHGLPYLMASQAQKHITHNESVRMLDALVHLTISSIGTQSPPGSPVEGDAFIIGANPTASWSGNPNAIATWQDGAWFYFTPIVGVTAWNVERGEFIAYDGTNWKPVVGAETLSKLGINAVADQINRLSVSSDATLFNHDGDGHQIKINKSQEAKTASLVLQESFNGHAEIGLSGDNDLSFKVSADGQNWFTALKADRESGIVDMPNSQYLSNFAVNLLSDSGRFSSGGSGISSGAFAKPAYLQEYNSSQFSSHAKYINNNNDYGGSAGALDADVKELVEQIRHASYRRNGLEFYVAELEMGSGTNYSLTHNAADYYLSLNFRQSARLAVATIHFYTKPIVGDLLLRLLPGQSVSIDGANSITGNVVIPQGGSWKSVLIKDAVDPYTSWGYSPSHLNIYQENSGDKVLFACLALLGGQTPVNIQSGVLPNYQSWNA